MITKILALIIRFGIILLKLELEKPEDFSGVEDLYDICFSPSRKVLSSYRLRENVKPIDKLCYLAKNETGSILCAVRYWPIKIQRFKFLLLGPLAVHPTIQAEGHGNYIINETLTRAEKFGWQAVILIGDLSYYRQFNFIIAKSIEFPLPTNPKRTLIKSLNGFDISLIKGKVGRWGAE